MISRIQTATLIPPSELQQVEKGLSFAYKQGMGEIIYTMVTCHPYIPYPIIELSQYSAKSARIHFVASWTLYQFLKDTKDKGIHYWRKTQDQIVRMNILRLH